MAVTEKGAATPPGSLRDTRQATAEPAYLRAFLDAIPIPVFLVDARVLVHDANQSGREFCGVAPGGAMLCGPGELLHCAECDPPLHPCGAGPLCEDCQVRHAIEGAVAGRRVLRRVVRMRVRRDRAARDAWYRVSTAPFAGAPGNLALLALEDVSELLELRSLIPMCAHCRKVRNEREYWQHVEDYLREHTGVQFTHGFCPDCLRELYPEVAEDREAAPPDSGAGAPQGT
ncbi:MAG: PAS domain-containing protein [Lentisphaeria bacterium]|nr:PAS domain-containing protein [Lentisphaeria bacterium]